MILRPVAESDMGFLYQLLARRDRRVSISHVSLPTWTEHCEFWRREPYAAAWIIELDGDTTAGYVYLSRQNEIGIHLARECQGEGIGPEVIRHITRSHPGKTFYANVSPYNTHSQHMFEGLGWRIVQMTYAFTSPNGD